MKLPDDLASGEGPLPGLQTATFSLCAYMAGRKGERGGQREREGDFPLLSYRTTSPTGPGHLCDFI